MIFRASFIGISLALLLIFSACQNRDEKIDTNELPILFKWEFYPDKGLVKEIRMNRDSLPLQVMTFDMETGRLFYLETNISETESQEVLFFHNNGRVSSKENRNESINNGYAYYYYKSGVRMAWRYWIDDLKVGTANDFYDTTGNMKAVMLYNDLGQLYYRRNLDRQGNILSTEGSK